MILGHRDRVSAPATHDHGRARQRPAPARRPGPPLRNGAGPTGERRRRRAQAAGPLASVTVAVCACPLVSVQPMLTLSPGWCRIMICWTLVPEVTCWPPTEVTTSNWVSPAEAAGVPGTLP